MSTSTQEQDTRVGTVGHTDVWELQPEYQHKWEQAQDQVLRVLERNPSSHNYGPKPLSLLEAYEVKQWTWLHLQKKRLPTIVIICSSPSYGNHLKKTLEKGVKQELLEPSIAEFKVIVIQGTFVPCNTSPERPLPC